jgi:hypothetical protein
MGAFRNKMSEIEVPCKECISLAICYHQDTLYCEYLYNYICASNSEGFENYKPNRAKTIYRVFNRYITNTLWSEYMVKLMKLDDYSGQVAHEDLLTEYVKESRFYDYNKLNNR